MAKEKTKHDGLLCFLLAVIVVLILVIGGGAYYFLVVDNGEEIAENKTENNSAIVENEKDNNVETTIENEKKIKKIDETKEIVYTIEKQVTLEGQMEGQDEIVTNKIPVINLDYDFIKNINNEIEKNYENREKWLELYDYKYYLNDNILSVVIEKENWHVGGLEQFDVYNIDIYKGTLIEEKSLLHELKKDSNLVIEEVKNIVKKESYTENIGLTEKDKEFAEQQYNRTVYEIVNDKNIQYFLDDKGILNFIIKRYNIAGGESTYVIYKLDKETDNKYSEITKRLENKDVLSITESIKNNNGTYTLKGEIITVDTSKEQIAEYPFYKKTGEYKQITVPSNTKCEYSLDSNEYKTDTVENVFSKDLSFGGCFNFNFENGKCISVVEVVTGH